MGWIPGYGSLYMVHPFISAPNFVSVTPSKGVLFPLLRRGIVSTLQSSFFLSFMCLGNCILYLGYPRFWANIHLSVSAYQVSSEAIPTSKKDTCSTMFIAALFIIARSWKEPRCPSTEEWIQKMWYIYTMEYYSAIKKNEFMKFLAKWMDLEGIILSEVTHSQRNSHNMYSLISGY